MPQASNRPHRMEQEVKVLVEHVLFSPYTGTIYGGAEKSTYAMADALRKRGHQVDIVAPQDSTLDCIKAPVWSGQHVVQHGGVLKNTFSITYRYQQHYRMNA